MYGCWSREITPLQSGTSIMPEETPRVDKGSGVGGKTIRQACVCVGGGGGGGGYQMTSMVIGLEGDVSHSKKLGTHSGGYEGFQV